MNRQEKQELLGKLAEMYSQNQFVFLVGLKAVNASNALAFRAEARKAEAHCVVAKNTLGKIAAKQVGLEGLENYFREQTLTIFTNNPVEVAKLLEKYQEKGYVAVAGSDKTTIFSEADVKKLAKVPAMPVLRGMLLSSILGVHRKTVRVLSESAASLVRLIATRSTN